MKILAATNAFKGSPADVIKLNDAIADELKGHDVTVFPIADGGDGTLEAFQGNFGSAAEVRTATVKNALGTDVEADWLYIPKSSGVVEKDTGFVVLANASGMAMLKPGERNPLITSTFGTGQLVGEALDAGCEEIKLTVGGSATVDAGLGFGKALGLVAYDFSGVEIKPGGENLSKVHSIDVAPALARLGNAEIEFLSDVQTPLRSTDGENVMLYGPQKFANLEGLDIPGLRRKYAAELDVLDKGMDNIAGLVDGIAGKKASELPCTGAAGGTPYIPMALLGATAVSGIDRLAQMFDLEDRIKESEVVITGEGYLDISTLEGKGPAKVIELAKKHDKKVVVVCGGAEERDWTVEGIDLVIPIKPTEMKLQDSIDNTESLLRKAIRDNEMAIQGLI